MGPRVFDFRIVNFNRVSALTGSALSTIDFLAQKCYTKFFTVADPFIAALFKTDDFSTYYGLVSDSNIQISNYNYQYFSSNQGFIFTNMPGVSSNINITYPFP